MVSIVVGIYNVASYLIKKRLGCIVNQTFHDWELLLIDDGSTDDSGDICDELAREDSRIKVVHKENGGLGSARNAGLDIATGDYIWFYDVDDEAHSNLLEYAVAEMESKQLDMLQFGFKAISPGLKQEEDVRLNERMIENQDQLRNSYLDDILFVRIGNGFAWNKIIRRSLIEQYHLRYGDQRIQQDEVFNLRLYPLLQRVYLSPETLYDYYIYDTGNTRSHFIPNRFDIYVEIREEFERLRKTWNLQDPRFDNYINNRFYQSLDTTLRFNMLHSDCPWDKDRKKDEMARVMVHPYSQETMSWKRQNYSGLEDHLYYQAYLHQDLYSLYFFNKFFGLLRKAKHILRA